MVEAIAQKLTKYEGRRKFPDAPLIIQGGMGVGASNYKLARAAGIAGDQLDIPMLVVVSGTGAEELLLRRLSSGDEGGDMQRALREFPMPWVSEWILNDFYKNPKRSPNLLYQPFFMPPNVESIDDEVRLKTRLLSVAANFVEVWLAKQGHSQPVGVNHLHKIGILHPFRIYGAMQGGVDYLLEGAGLILQVPQLVEDLAVHRTGRFNLELVDSGKETYTVAFNPQVEAPELVGRKLTKPRILAIISTDAAAQVYEARAKGIYGYVGEHNTAGGHNAKPRGRKIELNDRGEPIYKERDEFDLKVMKKIGKPFWMAGSWGHADRVVEALEKGAVGVQVGTKFALSQESGLREDGKKAIRQEIYDGTIDVFTSLTASPTGYPLKVVRLTGTETLVDKKTYEGRQRRCTMKHLLEYRAEPRAQSSVGLHEGDIESRDSLKLVGFCPAEPKASYLQKRKKTYAQLSPEEQARLDESICACNGLIAAEGHPQVDKHGEEPAFYTLGNDTDSVREELSSRDGVYTARQVVESLISKL